MTRQSASAEADPSAFVRHDGLLMIDEIQRAPELLLPIKREVDRDTRPWQVPADWLGSVSFGDG